MRSQVFKAKEQVRPANGKKDDDGGGDDWSGAGTPARGRGGVGGRTIRSKSVGTQFKDSLAELMGTISATRPR